MLYFCLVHHLKSCVGLFSSADTMFWFGCSVALRRYARVVQSTFKNMLLPLRPAGEKAEDGEADLPMLNLEGVPNQKLPLILLPAVAPLFQPSTRSPPSSLTWILIFNVTLSNPIDFGGEMASVNYRFLARPCRPSGSSGKITSRSGSGSGCRTLHAGSATALSTDNSTTRSTRCQLKPLCLNPVSHHLASFWVDGGAHLGH